MTSTEYRRMEEDNLPPQYEFTRESETPLLHPPTETHHPVGQGYTRELNRCCVCFTILNFICLPWCGIPALIFTILGLEAEKKNARTTARTHSRYMSFFNRMGCTCITLLILLYLVCSLIQYIVYRAEFHRVEAYTFNTWSFEPFITATYPTGSSYEDNYN